MQVKITKTHSTDEWVELTLPYYFEHDCGGDSYDSVSYGKIEATRTTIIGLGRAQWDSVEIEVKRCAPEAVACYLAEKYRSTEAAYLKAKAMAAEFVSGA